MRLIR